MRYKKISTYFLLFFFLSPIYAIASDIDNDSLPISEIIVNRKSYSLSYDGQHHQPRWIYECLTAKNIEGEASRNNQKFSEDPLIPEIFSSTNSDYLGSGFDRGHLAPCGDFLYSQEALEETFFLSNISPQHPSFNRGFWKKLEKHIRSLTKHYQTLHVFSGALYLPIMEEDGKLYVKYQVIGENHVAVPTHFFKIIFVEIVDKIFYLKSYILPNIYIETKKPLDDFLISLELIEKSAGIIFPWH